MITGATAIKLLGAVGLSPSSRWPVTSAACRPAAGSPQFSGRAQQLRVLLPAPLQTAPEQPAQVSKPITAPCNGQGREGPTKGTGSAALLFAAAQVLLNYDLQGGEHVGQGSKYFSLNLCKINVLSPQ